MALIRAEEVMYSSGAHPRHKHAPEFEEGVAFMSGEYVPVEKAGVSITDTGFMQADGTYDVVSVSKGMFFRLEDHLNRFEKGCGLFRMRNPYSRQQMREILENLVRLSGLQDAYVWYGVTRGQMPHTDRNDVNLYECQFYAFVIPYLFIADDQMREKGLSLHVSQSYIRIPERAVDPRAKNFHWMDLKLSLFEAKDSGRDWSVLLDVDGYLTECPGANIFFIKDGRICTPANGCLEGITRLSTFELAKEVGLELEIGRFHVSALEAADEIFLTSTAGGIIPIRSLGGKSIASNREDSFTRKMHDLYWTKRWAGWHGKPVTYD